MAARTQKSSRPASAVLPRRAAERGFTLIEILVSLAVMVVVLGALLGVLQLNSRIAKAQVNVSEMQQALRAVQADMVRTARMAGRGGLPVRDETAGVLLPQGTSIAVDNNVATGTPPLGGVNEAAVLPGTDVLTVRGVITTPLYQVNPAGDGDVRGALAAGEGSITIRSTSPTGVPQDLSALRNAIEDDLPEALLLVSAGSDEIHAVVELKGGTHSTDEVTLNFTLGGTHSTQYLKLSHRGEFPVGLRSVAMVGLLEEYRYYVRDVAPAPRLSRGRFYPGTEVAHNGDANAYVDLADNILDLQVALGVDLDGNQLVEDTGDADDDWLYNAAGESDDETKWNGSDDPLYYLRITTLARTDRADPKYTSPAIDRIEDREYLEPEVPAASAVIDRSYRRRILQTVVDLRNLS